MSGPQTDRPNTSNLNGDLRIYQKVIIEAAARAPLSIRNDIVGGVADVIYYLDNLTQWRAEANQALGDPRYSAQEQLRQANVIMSDAFKASDAANNTLAQAIADARKQLEASLLPKAPRDMTEALMLDRKADLTLLLQNTPGVAADKVEALKKELRRALQTDDQLTAYVLANKMQFIYRAAGIDLGTITQAYAAVLGEPVDDGSRDPLPGAQLLASLQRGGPNTVLGVRDVARNRLFQAQDGWQKYAASFGR
jgi:hypothetical protein